MKSLKTPLRYPGGKSRAVVKLFQYFPDLSNYSEFREPFLGGGSVALAVTQRYTNLPIWVNDLYEPLYNFWITLRDQGQDLEDTLTNFKEALGDVPDKSGDPKLLEAYYDKAKVLFLNQKQLVDDGTRSNLERAVSFYIVNKCSFSGLTESSSFSAQASIANFSMAGIKKIKNYCDLIQNWRITNFTYDMLLDCNKNAFVYLDPPYDIKDNLYGKGGSMHKGFDHDKFCIDCELNMTSNMLISYNSSNIVKDRFVTRGWKDHDFAHTYTMRSTGTYTTDQASRKELVLINYEV